jgi:RNA polymerase sigma factor (sigma-70 family)
MSQSSGDQFQTHQSVLIGVSDPSNHRAWELFVVRYGPMIRGWCRHWFPGAADEMSHEVFAQLVFVMRHYQYRPELGRFRGWLKTVTHRLMAELKREEGRYREWGEALDGIEAPIDLETRLAAEYDLELLEKARENVRGRVKASTWTAYVETAEQGRRPDEVAHELDMKVGAVYQARHAVLTALRLEVKLLDGSCGSEVP